ncbi:hypothetical protein TrVE_jg9604 [Triparma verrucosa]|uniref:Uncharacterized protein n=1 Tax=Triparma verrucosa TaxID=1606542 RepID=A0A9W7FFB4_9STRA|nr:hypothetical protein TrVE_jg9604 [Triparma verrucosa]
MRFRITKLLEGLQRIKADAPEKGQQLLKLARKNGANNFKTLRGWRKQGATLGNLGVKKLKEQGGRGRKILFDGKKGAETMAVDKASRVKAVAISAARDVVVPQVNMVKQAAVTAAKEVAPEVKKIIGQGAKEASDSASSYVWGKAGKWFFIWSLSAVFVFAVGSSIPRAVLMTIAEESQRDKGGKEEGNNCSKSSSKEDG